MAITITGNLSGMKLKVPAKETAKASNWFTDFTNKIKNNIIANTMTSAAKLISSSAADNKKAAAESAAKKQQPATSAPAAPAVSAGTASANKDDLIEWGSNRFFVTPGHIRSYKDLSIATTCNTEDEENGGDKYATKKQNGAYEMRMTALLDKRLGETDVRTEAMRLAEQARTGAIGYVYSCGTKLFTPQMMGTGATIQNIVTTPKGMWISCEVALTLKQTGKSTGGGTSPTPSSGSGGGGGGNGLGQSWAAIVYYSMSSGAIQSVSATSNISYDDAVKKAYAKVPKGALWASTNRNQATNQTPQSTSATNAANNATNNAKHDAASYVNNKFNSIHQDNGSSGKIKPAINAKITLPHSIID